MHKLYGYWLHLFCVLKTHTYILYINICLSFPKTRRARIRCLQSPSRRKVKTAWSCLARAREALVDSSWGRQRGGPAGRPTQNSHL